MKKIFIKIVSLIFIFMLCIPNVSALNLTKIGDSIVEEGEYDSIRFVAGNNVINKANIDGISFIAGNEITTEGTSTYGVYAGNNITIKENIAKDLFVAGNKIIITEDAKIGRDLFIAGANVTIMTNIIRDIRIGASNINISGITINGDAYLYADNITLNEDTVITGKLTYPEDANIVGLDLAKVGETITTKKVDVEIKKTKTLNIENFIFSICAGIVIMLILFYLLPKTKDKLDNIELKAEPIIKLMCVGLLVLILTPLIVIMTIFTKVLTPFALILMCLYGISVYLGPLISSYIIGTILTTKTLNKNNKYLALSIGIIIVKLVKLIPYIGNFIGLLCMLYGIGLITKYLKLRKN